MAKRKVEVELPEEVIEALKDQTKEGENPADALAKAILTRQALKKEGRKVFVEDEDGTVSEVELK